MDPDRDGIETAEDRCPLEPEDCDSILDGDGCPEDDGDGDGVKDVCDHCPMQPGIDRPEHPHGRGCPHIDAFADSGEFLRNATVIFGRDSAKAPPRAPEALRDVASGMVKLPAHIRFFVIGHATPEERDPDALSERRAAEIVSALVALGVDRARLEPHGAGAARPVFSGEPRGPTLPRSRRVELDLSHNHARQRHWSAERKEVEDVIPEDLPCDAPTASAPGPCPVQRMVP